MDRRLDTVRILAPAVGLALLVLMLLGGFVTASASGLGCGTEWPLCMHGLVPPAADFHAWVEWAHRLAASLVTIGVVALAVVLRRRGASEECTSIRMMRRLSLVAVGLILVEVLLGMATVLLGVPAWVVALHMADAIAVLDVTAALAYVAWRPEGATAGADGPAGSVLWWAAGFASLTAVLGSYVTHSGAGAACLQGPSCIGRVGGPGGSQVLAFGLHVTAALTLGLAAIAARGGARRRAPRLYAAAASALGTQAALGIALIWSRLSAALLVAHEGVGIATAVLWWLTAWAVQGHDQAGSFVDEKRLVAKGG